MPRKSEVKILTDLLLRDWDSPESLASALIKAIDEARAERTGYVAVMQFGKRKPVFYAGIGPYPGQKSARNAIEGFPGATEATAIAVVPVTNKEGLKAQLERTG